MSSDVTSRDTRCQAPAGHKRDVLEGLKEVND